LRDHPEKFGISFPITGKHQLGIYKQYLLAVNFFVDYFHKNGVPKIRDLRASITNLPDTPVSSSLRREAAINAIKELGWSGGLSRKQKERMQKMTEEEKKAFLQEREKRRLEGMKRNAEPRFGFKVGDLLERWVNIEGMAFTVSGTPSRWL